MIETAALIWLPTELSQPDNSFTINRLLTSSHVILMAMPMIGMVRQAAIVAVMPGRDSTMTSVCAMYMMRNIHRALIRATKQATRLMR